MGGGGGGGQKRRAAELCKEEEEVAPSPTFLLLRPAASGFFFSGLLPIKEKTQQHHHRHHLLRSNCVVARGLFLSVPTLRSPPATPRLARGGQREKLRATRIICDCVATTTLRANERTGALTTKIPARFPFPISLPHRLLLFLPPGFSLFFVFPSLSN